MKFYKNLLLVLALFLCGCSNKEEGMLKDALTNNTAEFSQIAQSFLAEPKLTALTVLGNAEIKCEYINSWMHCPPEAGFKRWEPEQKKYTDMIPAGDVLKLENIPYESYGIYKFFLEKHGISTIKKSPGGWIELENINYGLRYNPVPGMDLKEDDKFLSVTKIDQNWYLYERENKSGL